MNLWCPMVSADPSSGDVSKYYQTKKKIYYSPSSGKFIAIKFRVDNSVEALEVFQNIVN